jgi:hypothetical protein
VRSILDPVPVAIQADRPLAKSMIDALSVCHSTVYKFPALKNTKAANSRFHGGNR